MDGASANAHMLRKKNQQAAGGTAAQQRVKIMAKIKL